MRKQRKVLEGIVVSAKMEKTAVVKVSRKFRHPKYNKLVKKSKKYYAHNEKEGLQEGQTVQIRECRPMSKTKRWIVIGSITPS